MKDLVAALKLITKNDGNGNSRSIYLGLNADGHVAVVNSDTSNIPSWIKDLHNNGIWEVAITVPPTEYRRWKSMEVNLGG